MATRLDLVAIAIPSVVGNSSSIPLVTNGALSVYGISIAINIQWHISHSEAWTFLLDDPPASLAADQSWRVRYNAQPNQSGGQHDYDQPSHLTITYSNLSGVRFRRIFRIEIEGWNYLRFHPFPAELIEPPTFQSGLNFLFCI